LIWEHNRGTNKQHYLDLEKSENPNWDRLEKEAMIL
jgi:hypothetical protein